MKVQKSDKIKLKKKAQMEKEKMIMVGFASSVAETLVIQPLDITKTRMQLCQTPKNFSILSILKNIVREEGFLRFYRVSWNHTHFSFSDFFFVISVICATGSRAPSHGHRPKGCSVGGLLRAFQAHSPQDKRQQEIHHTRRRTRWIPFCRPRVT